VRVPPEFVKLPETWPSLLTTRFQFPLSAPEYIPRKAVITPPALVGTKSKENCPPLPLELVKFPSIRESGFPTAAPVKM
jgi:hypothetical protein